MSPHEQVTARRARGRYARIALALDELCEAAGELECSVPGRLDGQGKPAVALGPDERYDTLEEARAGGLRALATAQAALATVARVLVDLRAETPDECAARELRGRAPLVRVLDASRAALASALFLCEEAAYAPRTLREREDSVLDLATSDEQKCARLRLLASDLCIEAGGGRTHAVRITSELRADLQLVLGDADVRRCLSPALRKSFDALAAGAL